MKVCPMVTIKNDKGNFQGMVEILNSAAVRNMTQNVKDEGKAGASNKTRKKQR